MGCATCSSGDGEVTTGCQNNGGCSTGGCNKLNTFDWLSNMDRPIQTLCDLVEVRFKNGRKDFFRNSNDVDLTTGDAVIVDVPNGHHLGHVALMGELVKLQMRKKHVKDNDEIKSIYRLATSKDIEKYREVKNRESSTMYKSREIIQELKLQMKLTDVEFQADSAKATFYYSAEERVDFRELIKRLAGEFKIRVEMRQISLRQEAGRLGGIGSCGRELCCSTWLTDFKSVSTQAARYQNLSLNPGKLSGQCGRLKCCLNYELDTYMDALKDIPEVSKPLLTLRGPARLQKTDIFRKIMWFGYADDNNWYSLSTERVIEIQEINKKGQKVDTLTIDEELATSPQQDTLLNSDLAQMDRKFSNGGKKKTKKKNWNNRRKKGSGNNKQNAIPKGKKQ